MKKNKKFDCVQMKWDIQQRIQKEYEGLPKQDAHNRQMAQIDQNSILGPYLKRVQSAKKVSAK